MAALTPHDRELGYRRLRMPASMRPTLFVVIDTEEEFDWSAGFRRDNRAVTAMAHIGRAQRVFERYGVKPTYVIDFPVASNPDGYMPVKEVADSGACAVGAHLHPWVNPPYSDEPDTRRNSFACNLDADLEAAKLEALTSEIGEHLGIAPKVYRAGRYGFGPSTVATLEQLGFDVDVSINPHMDFTAEDGPSFEAFDATPFFFGRRRRILEIPCATGYVGVAAHAGATADRLASTPLGRALHLGGILSRLGVSEKIVLSPEQSSAGEMRRLTEALFARGLRTFVLSFHSPSLAPGHTPYVQTAGDLERFLDRLDEYCDYFCGTLAGVATTPEEFVAQEPVS